LFFLSFSGTFFSLSVFLLQFIEMRGWLFSVFGYFFHFYFFSTATATACFASVMEGRFGWLCKARFFCVYIFLPTGYLLVDCCRLDWAAGMVTACCWCDWLGGQEEGEGERVRDRLAGCSSRSRYLGRGGGGWPVGINYGLDVAAAATAAAAADMNEMRVKTF
jgi:hypothetical protein